MRRNLLLALAAFALLAVVACPNSEPDSEPSPSPSGSVPTTRPSSTAKVTIVEPTSDAVLEGPAVRVKITLSGGRIVEQVTTNIRPDEGHIHLILDGKTVNLTGGLEETISDVSKGVHLLQVEFVAADHGIFDPRVIAAATFTVA